MLRYGKTINTFCSYSCRAHFMYKYQLLEACSVCRRLKSNFNMLQSMADDTTVKFKYCSMKCLQIVNQSIELVELFRRYSAQ